jgi:glycosyltransferase involved in cell wall biosynthesis
VSQRPLRVAMTIEQCWHPVPGGTATAALELGRELARTADVELVGVAALHRRPPPPAWRPSFPVQNLPLPRHALYEAWHVLRRPRVERATGRVDVIHATGLAMPPPSAPIVLTIHDLSFLRYPDYFSRAGLRFFRQSLELALREARLVLCSSRATVADCRAAGFDERRLRHVPLGVDSEPADHAAIERVRRTYSLDRPYVLWTGTMEPRKNLAGLLDAYALVDADVDLVLVGPRGWKESVSQRLVALPERVRRRVRMLGFVPRMDLEPLYAGATVFCFPSLLEGFGLPVVEAMAQGTPVVTSQGTSTEELAEHAGLLIDPRDPAAIARAVTCILADEGLADRLGQAGRARAEGYTWARTAELVTSAYREARAEDVSTMRGADE